MIELKEGKIATDLPDVEFLDFVLLKWAGYDEDEIVYLLDPIEDMTESEFRTQGVEIEENTHFLKPERIVLIKVGKGLWVIADGGLWEMTDFVDRMNEEEVEVEELD